MQANLRNPARCVFLEGGGVFGSRTKLQSHHRNGELTCMHGCFQSAGANLIAGSKRMRCCIATQSVHRGGVTVIRWQMPGYHGSMQSTRHCL